MTRDFLKSLEGLDTSDAEGLVRKAGYKSEVCKGMARPAVAIRGLVVLWEKRGKIYLATAGDPCEVTKSASPKGTPDRPRFVF